MRCIRVVMAVVSVLLPCGGLDAQTTMPSAASQRDLDRINETWHVGGGSANPDNVAADVRLFEPLLEAAPKTGIVVTRDLSYGPEPAQRLDVYGREGLTGAPVVIYVHGGAYVRGDKNLTGEIFANVSTWFARQGVLGINANYRLAPGAAWPSGAQDVRAVIAWAKANAARYGGDPDRIFLMGNSAGATHIASYVFDRSLQPPGGPGVAGAILISGRYAVTTDPSSPVRGSLQAYFGTDPTAYRERSPLSHVDETKLPVFIVFAEFDDPGLDVVGAQLFAALCRRDGACPRIHRMLGHNHLSEVFAFNTADETLGREILDFMRRRR